MTPLKARIGSSVSQVKPCRGCFSLEPDVGMAKTQTTTRPGGEGGAAPRPGGHAPHAEGLRGGWSATP